MKITNSFWKSIVFCVIAFAIIPCFCGLCGAGIIDPKVVLQSEMDFRLLFVDETTLSGLKKQGEVRVLSLPRSVELIKIPLSVEFDAVQALAGESLIRKWKVGQRPDLFLVTKDRIVSGRVLVEEKVKITPGDLIFVGLIYD